MSILYKKDSYANYLSYETFGTFVALMGAELWQLPGRVIFGGFLQLSPSPEFPGTCECKNLPKITLYGNSHSSEAIIASQVHNVPYER